MDKNTGRFFSDLSSSLGTNCFIAFITSILLRLIYVIYRTGKPLYKRSPPQALSTLIVLGSGGHTAEMINLLLVLQKDRFAPRFYIAAATDNMSLQKARMLENSWPDSQSGVKGISAEFMQIYRSREVGQSYVTSVWTTLVATVHASWLMIKIRPEVVIGIRWSSIFYVESIARVKKLSLSGLLLYKLQIADQFFVQWPQLQRKYPQAHYVGCLM